MNYYDTSIFIAAFQESHVRHMQAFKAIAEINKRQSACSAHSLIELYSVFTRIPPPMRLSPQDALAIVEQLQSRITSVSLTPAEYLNVVRNAASHGITGGAIYDAIHIHCAKKVNAAKIYTLDKGDFFRIDPSLAAKIVTP